MKKFNKEDYDALKNVVDILEDSSGGFEVEGVKRARKSLDILFNEFSVNIKDVDRKRYYIIPYEVSLSKGSSPYGEKYKGMINYISESGFMNRAMLDCAICQQIVDLGIGLVTGSICLLDINEVSEQEYKEWIEEKN